jgi:regulatory protein
MLITQLEELEKSKVRVYLDNEYAFLLYRKDIEKFKLIEGNEISFEVYEKILTDTVYRRAKQKALAILKFMDRTELELRRKLSDAGYPEKIIDRTISYVIEYGYLNDERYALTYVRARMNTKSKLVIRTELLQKGISKDLTERILEEEYEQDEIGEDVEMTALRKAIAKKTKSVENLSLDDKRKLMAALYRKGFDVGKIKKALT